ncbi:SPOSA6832_03241 [Sporobolomyces salmonicolor]|uniref:SPOSA6832_03241-mRNA-1:cds n=1 Tax=Sporidiobolus salmonicolor TaxID=5005 RepID=A0A0D6ENY5_SPOSA|nr:SPOSA6832_03241 [Sporobolomyces salmonicolor]
MPSATETVTSAIHSLSIRPQAEEKPDAPAVSTTPSPASAPKQKLQWPSQNAKPGESYKYERFLPYFDHDLHLPPLQPFEHVDPEITSPSPSGLKALDDPEPRSFLNGASIEELTPEFGSEVEGVQLHELDARGRQQLARYVAERGVVAFRDQDFADQDPEWQLRNWGEFFGRLHIHPCSGAPKDYPEFHLVYRDGKSVFNYEQDTRLTSSVWHSDVCTSFVSLPFSSSPESTQQVTYEEQPPGLTVLFLYDSPTSGGDTGYADQRYLLHFCVHPYNRLQSFFPRGAYNHLSSNFRAYLETLQVVHSGVEQAQFSRSGNRGGIVKREPVENVHPLVRRHPVTGEKALFVNPQFSRRIVGLKKEESDAILGLLYKHIAQGVDFQTRVRWKPRTVVVWDNRITAHTAIVDFAKGGARRHGARITPQAERPFI